MPGNNELIVSRFFLPIGNCFDCCHYYLLDTSSQEFRLKFPAHRVAKATFKLALFLFGVHFRAIVGLTLRNQAFQKKKKRLDCYGVLA